ncbi:hypothetical protein, partial [Nocardia wallacei]|uniref:hypothetical protein n=1 Tax=Nocardia wallacei TaxID=480035 RepID=UPI002454F8E3
MVGGVLLRGADEVAPGVLDGAALDDGAAGVVVAAGARVGCPSSNRGGTAGRGRGGGGPPPRPPPPRGGAAPPPAIGYARIHTADARGFRNHGSTPMLGGYRRRCGAGR